MTRMRATPIRTFISETRRASSSIMLACSKIYKIFGLYGEVPVEIFPRMYIHTDQNQIPKDIGAVFATPSVRVNFFSRYSVTPWVSVGGGYGHFRESSNRIFYGANPGETGTNTGVIQFGAGLD